MIPQVSFLPVLVSGVVIFLLGGVWYSPVLFAKRWVALIGKSEEEMKAAAASAGPLLYLQALLAGLLSAWALAVLLNHFGNLDAARGAAVGVLCWLGFAGATSYANTIFSMKPKGLWLIDTGFNLVSFVLAGALLAVWR